MRHTTLITTAALLVLLFACGGPSASEPVVTTRVEIATPTTIDTTAVTTRPSTTTRSESSTTTPPGADHRSEGQYTTTGKQFHLYQPDQPTHTVVLLHGLNTPLVAMEPLAEQFLSDNGLVFVPGFDLSIEPGNRAAEAKQVACAIAYASSLGSGLPIVLVGFSGGGYHAGLYVATGGSHWDPTECLVDSPADQLRGFVLLDGPVDDPGWREAVGLPPNENADAHLWDPVSMATPNPDIAGAYFISGDLPDYAWAAMEKFNKALGIECPITQLETSHGGLISGSFSAIPAAVHDIAISEGVCVS